MKNNIQTVLPTDFKVTEDHRDYCSERWGHPMIADTFLEEFREYWLEGEGKGEKKKNWDKAFTNWIRRVSPLETRRLDRWEVHLERAKKLEFGDRRRKEPVYHPREIQERPVSPQVVEAAMSKLRGLLR